MESAHERKHACERGQEWAGEYGCTVGYRGGASERLNVRLGVGAKDQNNWTFANLAPALRYQTCWVIVVRPRSALPSRPYQNLSFDVLTLLDRKCALCITNI